MKKICLVLGVLVAMVWFAGCAARVNLGLSSYGKNIKFDRAGGYSSPERGLDILDQQARVQTQILLQEKLQKAIKDNDRDQIEKVLKMMEIVNGNGSATARYRNLHIVNRSTKYVVEILSEPFTGETLNPGEKTSRQKPFLVGVCPVTFRWYEIGTNAKGVKTVNASIGKQRRKPITIFD